MSFLPGFGRRQPSSAEKIANAEAEMDMIGEMMARLNQSCLKKCIQPDYHEGDLTKGESVCLDRCVGKFFEVQMKISEKMQGDAAMKQGM
ncbi:protein transporter tim10 [Xanthoria parietina]